MNMTSKTRGRVAVASLVFSLAWHSGFADAKKPAIDCDALGRFAQLSLTNRLIGVPYQPSALNLYLESSPVPERTTQSSKLDIFAEAYKDESLHKTPEAFGQEIRQHSRAASF
jgi:hypothetical protein